MSNTCDAPVFGGLLEVFGPLVGSSIPASSSARLMSHINFRLNLLNQLTVFIITANISWVCIKLRFQKTACHAFLCTVGFILLYVQAMLTHYRHNILTYGLSEDNKLWLRQVLLFAGGVLGIVGTLQKSLGKKRHFHTLHGIFGLLACVFFCLICLLNFCEMGLICRANALPAAYAHFGKSVLDLITFLLGFITQHYGYETGFFRRNFTNINCYKFTTIAVYVLTTAAPLMATVTKFYEIFY